MSDKSKIEWTEARPMHPDWVRSIRDQCLAANVPFFCKQMSKKATIPDDLMIREYPPEWLAIEKGLI